MAENRYLWIANNFAHDLATGVWAACLLVTWMLASRLAGMPDAAAGAVRESMWMLFKVALAALVVIAVTGGVRLGYWRRQSVGEEDEKRRSLLVKHAAFALVYGAGTAWLWTLVT